MKNINEVISEVDEAIKNGNFEEVLAKTKSYAEKATKKSAEKIEISRKKIELLDSKTKLSKAYEKFGKLEYAKREGEEVNEDEYKSALAQIELQKIRADMLDKEIEDLRALFSESTTRTDDEPEVAESEIEVETVNPEE